MKKIIPIVLILVSMRAYGQVPEDAIRYSWYPQNGTARNMAIGGVMGSLGGDITAAFVNPAGLGFFKTNEVVLSPGISMNNNKANFRQAVTLDKQKTFSFGPSGVILGFPSRMDADKNNAISFAINQVANFNNEIHYKALNNYSSFAEQFAEELAKSGAPASDFLYTNSSAPYTIAPAWNAFLIDTVNINGILQVRAAPERILDSGQAIQQEMIKRTKGGIYELAFSFAENTNKKWLWGLTIGIPIVSYKSNSSFSENDTSGNRFNGFKSFTYQDNFKTSGVGVNLKIGAIYRPAEYIRLGLAVHTPSFISLSDKRTVTLNTQLESDTGTLESYSESSLTYTSNSRGEAKYFQSSAWKAIMSASWVFREIQDVTKQRGFISADIEYVNHKGSRFSSNNEQPTQDEIAYYKALNKVVKHEYKGTFNFKVGGEVKFNIIMARLGFAYYGNPYKDHSLKANQALYSGGLGYRDKGFFIDLTYVQRITKDVNFPYRLEDRANTFASLKQQQGSIVAGFGFKF
ncbi:MAG: hypothetical protein ABIT58_08120 [Ferruginibacter sp.]